MKWKINSFETDPGGGSSLVDEMMEFQDADEDGDTFSDDLPVECKPVQKVQSKYYF